MEPTAFENLRNFFASDFLLAVFGPVLLFLGASFALYLEISGSLAAAIEQWQALPLVTQALSALVALIIVTACAYFVYQFQYTITQMFEGYGVVRWLLRGRLKFHTARWNYLKRMVEAGHQAVTAPATGREDYAGGLCQNSAYTSALQRFQAI